MIGLRFLTLPKNDPVILNQSIRRNKEDSKL